MRGLIWAIVGVLPVEIYLPVLVCLSYSNSRGAFLRASLGSPLASACMSRKNDATMLPRRYAFLCIVLRRAARRWSIVLVCLRIVDLVGGR